MSHLIAVRHGQSTWNLENKFTGWVDVDLSVLGIQEAHRAGKLLKGYAFEAAYTSVLIRAIHTVNIILQETDRTTIPVTQANAFNERHYGDLQGLDKTETERKYGQEQVHIWRRSYSIAPPGGESLQQTYERVVPYFKEELEPKLHSGKNLLLVAHGNSLRALAMYLEHITPEQISEVNIATGVPRIYSFDNHYQLQKAFYVN